MSSAHTRSRHSRRAAPDLRQGRPDRGARAPQALLGPRGATASLRRSFLLRLERAQALARLGCLGRIRIAADDLRIDLAGALGAVLDLLELRGRQEVRCSASGASAEEQ